MIGAITICFFHLHILWGELLNLKSTYPADSNTERVLTLFERLWMVDLFNLIDNAFCWVCWWDCFFNCIKCKLKSYFNWQSISFVSLLQRLNPTTILCCLAFHFFLQECDYHSAYCLLIVSVIQDATETLAGRAKYSFYRRTPSESLLRRSRVELKQI